VDEKTTMYPVCPDRNVVVAFQCFLGPDSRGLERFFSDQSIRWADDALLIVQVKGRRGVRAFANAVAGVNPLLMHGWIAASSAASGFTGYLADSTLVCSRFLLYHAVAAAGNFCAWLVHTLSDPSALGSLRDLLYRPQVHHPVVR
jgi:hypothetical protein